MRHVASVAQSFAERGFKADVRVLVAIHTAGGEQRHGFHRKHIRRHPGQLVRDGRVFCRWARPTVFVCQPTRGKFSGSVSPARCTRRATSIGPWSSVVNATRNPLPSASRMFSTGTRTLVKWMNAVVERLQAHEMAAVPHLNARPVHFDDERGDLILRFPMHHLRRRLGHDDNYAGLGAIGAPEFFTVQDEMFSVRVGFGARWPSPPGRSPRQLP